MLKANLLILLSVLLGAGGQVAMKWGTMLVKPPAEGGILALLFKYFSTWPILLGLSFYALSAVIWILAIAKVELSYAYPMVASGYVIVFILSYFLFQEPVSVQRIIGLITIVAGVLLISQS